VPVRERQEVQKVLFECFQTGVRRESIPERGPDFLARAFLRQHQAAESVRQQQQGHGNPIVSSMERRTATDS
jgi:hypothetical protein